MDTTIERQLDAILEDEIARGFSVVDVPTDIRAAIRRDGLSDVPRVRFTKLNTRRRRVASEIVARQYQKDLQNPDILSNEQVAKLNAERGEWTGDMEARKKQVQGKVDDLMTDLYAEGIKTQLTEWGTEILELAGQVRTEINGASLAESERLTLHALFNRWMEYSSEKQAEFTAEYAADQKRETYSHQTDMGALMDALAAISIEAMSVLTKLDDRMDKVHRFVQLTELRKELSDLNSKRARIFADTVESRRDHNEELARLYVSTERANDAGDNPMPAGPLAPKFEGLFDYPDEAITWLMEECWVFHSGLNSMYRDYLETFGFLRAERKPSDSAQAPSAESPAPQSSNPDSQPAAAVGSNSSVSPTATT